jgi:GLPGLI family protein
MKKIVLAVVGLFVLTANIKAQEIKSGAIQFITSIDPAAMAEANGMKLSPEMLARMQAVKTPYELLFNATNASYMKVEDTEDSNSEGGNRGGFRMGAFGGGSNRDYYYNIPEHKVTAAFDMRDTTYFMETKLGVADMPMTMPNRVAATPPVVEYIKSDEIKKIIGFNCHKVTMKTTMKRKINDEEKEIVTETALWYTKDLGFDFSPNPATWTEGAVLAMESKGFSTLATSIEYRKVSAKDVILPKKGTVITTAAFQSKMEDMMKARRGRQGSESGNVIRNIVIN